MSLVELMIGITIGLFILAAASMVATTQLGDNRRLLVEAQVQQDMRVITNLITRDLRRASYWGKAYFAVWPAVGASAVNPYSALTPTSAASAVKITYTRSVDEEGKAAVVSEKNDPEAASNNAGFWWDPEAKTLKALLGDGTWQTLNDPAVLLITRFSVRIDTEDVDVPCGAICPVLGPGGCPLKQAMRNATVEIVGMSTIDSNVKRSVSYDVRLRNDLVREAC